MKILSFLINFMLDLILKMLVYGIFLGFCKSSHVLLFTYVFHWYQVKYQMRNGTTCLEVSNVQNKKQNDATKLDSSDSILKQATSLVRSHTNLDHKQQVQLNYLCCLLIL